MCGNPPSVAAFDTHRLRHGFGGDSLLTRTHQSQSIHPLDGGYDLFGVFVCHRCEWEGQGNAMLGLWIYGRTTEWQAFRLSDNR